MSAPERPAAALGHIELALLNVKRALDCLSPHGFLTSLLREAEGDLRIALRDLSRRVACESTSGRPAHENSSPSSPQPGSASARTAESSLPVIQPPALFQARIQEPDGSYPCWPIDRVVAWSRTERGGKQFSLFGPPADDGCMRWGMCETKEPEAAP